jgi:hypothetical protein
MQSELLLEFICLLSPTVDKYFVISVGTMWATTAIALLPKDLSLIAISDPPH